MRDRVVRFAAVLSCGLVLFFSIFSSSLTLAEQTSYNHYTARLTKLVTIDFEEGNLDWGFPPGTLVNAGLTANPGEVLTGNYSLKLSGPKALFQIPASRLVLDRNKTYVVEFKYRVSKVSEPGSSAGLIFLTNQQQAIWPFPVPGYDAQLSGKAFGGLTTGESGVGVGMFTQDPDLIVDDIVVYRQDVDVSLAHIPLWSMAFPRLANYMTTTPAQVAAIGGVSQAKVEQTLARYDLVTGLTIDHTLGDGDWLLRLRQLNPKIRVLPYRESFVAQDLYTPVVGGNANLQALFNQGLSDKWFMKDPDGNRINEPDFPGNYQLNHTAYSPLVNNRSFADYMVDYLGRRVLPGGLVDGVHFDQPEWIPNPVLTPMSEGQGAPLPPIDLDNDGKAESTQTLYQAWYYAFFDYFQKVIDKFGFSQLLMGNPGYTAANLDTTRMLNGWVAEVLSPYLILPSGDWDTNQASGWYRVLNNYWAADAASRVPQMPFIEATGMKLGQQTGGFTFNGWPQRIQEIESRDYRRMRLGLTTALLGNGFFEYDLVDNTSIPVWFDEYAVDSNGMATEDVSAKGYLGQPLGPPVELDYAFRTLFNVDFETAVDQSFVHLSPIARFTTDSNEVVSGSRSAVFTKFGENDDATIFYTIPEENPLIEGRTYQLFMDYKVLSATSVTHKGPLTIGLFSRAQGLGHYNISNLYQADSSGAGQRGTLRSSVKVVGAKDYMALGTVPDVGSIAIDNIRLVEGAGGAWRRDFENGIVLVNPTPEAISVSLTQIQGPLHRTNIRRIKGNQVPSWNSGGPIPASGITIPSGDGIILLADPIASGIMTTPTNVLVYPAPHGATLTWQSNPQYVSGYHILYGENPAAMFQEAAAGREFSALQLPNLRPGAVYYFKVAAFDFKGNIGPYCTPVNVTLPGTDTRPAVAITSPTGAIAPGARLVLEGVAVADPYKVRVIVDGIDAPLLSSSTNRIDVQAPWEISGDKALIRVMGADGAYSDTIVDVQPVVPTLVDAVGVFRTTGDFEPNPEAFSAGDVAVFLAEGLGRVEPPPENGVTPERTSVVTAQVSATVSGLPATTYSTMLAADRPGQYYVVLGIPLDVPAGSQTVRLEVNGIATERTFKFH